MNNPSATGDSNGDPVTVEPNSHPVGTGGGAVGGATAGAAIGSTVGPVGTVIGGAIGAVVGGLAGNSVAETIDPSTEDEYWEEYHSRQHYADDSTSYEDYAPAYRAGYSAYAQRNGGRFDDIESDLEQSWAKAKGTTRLTWEKAKHASRAAWDRVERAIPGDFDGDGK